MNLEYIEKLITAFNEGRIDVKMFIGLSGDYYIGHLHEVIEIANDTNLDSIPKDLLID